MRPNEYGINTIGVKISDELQLLRQIVLSRDNHDLLPRPSRADSLDECRLEYGDAGIAANDTAIAANIISCMRNNNLLSSWLTIVLSIVSAAGFAGVASMASSSPKLKQWATEPPKKGN